MKRKQIVAAGASLLLGLAVGVAASSKASKALFEGKSAKEAGAAVIAVAQAQAESGTWENIAVGRIYYLSGDKARGREIFDKVLGGKKVKKDDWLRVARVYAEAGETAKAEERFEKAIALDPKDAENLAEFGAFCNLHGKRQKAEELFARAFQLKPDEFWVTINVAASYFGVKPQ